jgi:hypothetical protein
VNSSFVVQNNDQLEDYKINNVVMPYSSRFALQSQVESKEGEHMFLVSTNLLQDSIDKDRVYFNRGDYMFVGEGMLQTKTCGHILSSNIINSQYFGNLVCLHVVQNGIQATSTPRTTFHQEGEDDEIMTMLGELHGGQGDQQGHPNREGGPKLIRFESPRWRPKSSLSPPRNPEPVCLELVTQDAYGLRFR